MTDGPVAGAHLNEEFRRGAHRLRHRKLLLLPSCQVWKRPGGLGWMGEMKEDEHDDDDDDGGGGSDDDDDDEGGDEKPTVAVRLPCAPIDELSCSRSVACVPVAGGAGAVSSVAAAPFACAAP